jgi:hypothetical protein
MGQPFNGADQVADTTFTLVGGSPASQPCRLASHASVFNISAELWFAVGQCHPGINQGAKMGGFTLTPAKTRSRRTTGSTGRPDLGSGSGYFGCRRRQF